MSSNKDPQTICSICGESTTAKASLFKDPYFPHVRWHILCLNSPEGRRWRKEQEETNPGYKRYVTLASQGVPVRCPECGCEENFLWPKLQGHSPELEASCDRCARVNYSAFDPYAHEDVANEIQRLSDLFRLGKHPENLAELVQELARQHDHLIRPRECRCGGRFSLSAKPRCRNCRAIVSDSYFHYASEAPARAASLLLRSRQHIE